MSTSFRDPSGKIVIHQDRVFRIINKNGEPDFRTALKSKSLHNFINSGNLVSIYEPNSNISIEEIKDVFAIDESEMALIVEHEKIPFPSYPYEWSPEMLYSAGELTLDLARQLLNEGFGLKDATPYNILFRGSKPVFVDWLSFESRDLQNPIWLAQSQFSRTFLLPLMANKYFGLQLNQIFEASRDGLKPESLYKMSGLFRKILPPFITTVTIPTLLRSKSQKTPSIYQNQSSVNPEKAQFILNCQFKQLSRRLKKVSPHKNKTSDWTEYVGDNQHFTNEYFQQKRQFVIASLTDFPAQTILDVGCNTGYFSRIAAKTGANVISIDQDPLVIDKVWQMAKKENLNILPLVVDIARPSPAVGWQNTECPSFLNRIKGKVGAVLMLALIHHLLVTERIPLNEIVKLCSEMTTDTAIIEFIPPDDPMFKQIARGRDQLFENLNAEIFRQVCTKYFRIIRYEKLAESNRQIYLLKK